MIRFHYSRLLYTDTINDALNVSLVTGFSDTPAMKMEFFL